MEPSIENDQTNLWLQLQPNQGSKEVLSDSDDTSLMPADSLSDDLFDFDVNDRNFLLQSCFKRPLTQVEKMKKLQIVKLDAISISSSTAQPQQIVNLHQSFNFPSPLKSSNVISTQTSRLHLISALKPIKENGEQRRLCRPVSLPPDNVALTHLEKRVQADVEPKFFGKLIGDGDKRISQGNENDLKEPEVAQPDLELAVCIPQTPVQCVIIKPKPNSKVSRLQTPKFHCKKVLRPQTKHAKKRADFHLLISSSEDQTSPETAPGKSRKNQNLLLSKKTDLSKSDVSTEGSLEVSGNYHAKLQSVIDKLQDHEWEICLEGLRTFLVFATDIDWESELGQKFVPVISRKLIDFFKSPRSNLCRTACQTAGEFFAMAKSTKRPEFDEMIDILMCRTADPNRFIQKDATVALDKMAANICIHHSVRAVCTKSPDHKNPVVRASTARILLAICKKAGVEQIVGSDANPRTRKRVLATLAKFLMDKNLETRRHAEKLCKILKRHKFFMEYFFKDIDNNFKNSLRKIINALDAN